MCLLKLLLRGGLDDSISLEEELQEKKQVTCVHEESSLDISHVGPASLTSNMLQGILSQKDTYNHLNNLSNCDNDWVEPLKPTKEKK